MQEAVNSSLRSELRDMTARAAMYQTEMNETQANWQQQMQYQNAGFDDSYPDDDFQDADEYGDVWHPVTRKGQ